MEDRAERREVRAEEAEARTMARRDALDDHHRERRLEVHELFLSVAEGCIAQLQSALLLAAYPEIMGKPYPEGEGHSVEGIGEQVLRDLKSLTGRIDLVASDETRKAARDVLTKVEETDKKVKDNYRTGTVTSLGSLGEISGPIRRRLRTYTDAARIELGTSPRE